MVSLKKIWQKWYWNFAKTIYEGESCQKVLRAGELLRNIAKYGSETMGVDYVYIVTFKGGNAGP